MRVLFDHNLPRNLRNDFPSHFVSLTKEYGWNDLGNGKLLDAAQSLFDVLLTADANIYHQQKVALFDIAVVVLRVYDLRPDSLRLLIPDVLNLLNKVEPGKVYYLYADDKLKESDRRKGKGPATE
ncbi:MAG TPA: hypothetical protein PLD20_22645 [Blastocatellia bacterium]|nr:hypothetical protein [Blastocatellia bacterium]HMX25711.1 hypothetical protein [Blastocatellia bacterium]HMY70509.1 hypothetical protein [Blastocatellia bacterium]HMZ20751.1 hypothetical protein [Blastocatellia bacterium]HNG30558.1 hypothetical protein [Blastocatellia bacterium]